MYEITHIRITKFDVKRCIKHVALYLDYFLILRCSILQCKNEYNALVLFLSSQKYDNDIEIRSIV